MLREISHKRRQRYKVTLLDAKLMPFSMNLPAVWWAWSDRKTPQTGLLGCDKPGSLVYAPECGAFHYTLSNSVAIRGGADRCCARTALFSAVL